MNHQNARQTVARVPGVGYSELSGGARIDDMVRCSLGAGAPLFALLDACSVVATRLLSSGYRDGIKAGARPLKYTERPRTARASQGVCGMPCGVMTGGRAGRRGSPGDRAPGRQRENACPFSTFWPTGIGKWLKKK
jgi:hypothetical protein